MQVKQQHIKEDLIGKATEMSKGDIHVLNKVYSCEGGVSTNGGGNQQVYCTCLMIFCVHLQMFRF